MMTFLKLRTAPKIYNLPHFQPIITTSDKSTHYNSQPHNEFTCHILAFTKQFLVFNIHHIH